jgi:hypothetical protein
MKEELVKLLPRFDETLHRRGKTYISGDENCEKLYLLL